MRNFLIALRALVAAALMLAPSQARADEEQELLATLQSSASASVKSTACLRLRIIGTPTAVPALASLLGDGQTAHAARNALEGLPFPEAVVALRTALGTTSGPLKAGLVDSLGWRRDLASVPLLKPLLADENPDLAAAAATALARIGGNEAAAALRDAWGKVPPAVQPSVLNGSLLCADAMLRAGDSVGATLLYRDLLAAQGPESTTVAAWRGLAISDASQRGKRVLEALTGSSLPLRTAALSILRECNDGAVFSACLAQWPNLPPEAQLAMVETCSSPADSTETPSPARHLETLRLAAESPHLAVRIAAWKTLGNVGGGESIPALARAAAGSGEPAERDAAREALTGLRGPDVRQKLTDLLTTLDHPEQTEILRAIGERGESGAAGALLPYAAAEPAAVRLAALESLRKIASPETLLPLMELAAKSSPETDVQPILRALGAVCQASPDKDETTRQVLQSVDRLTAAQRRRVLPVFADLGTPAALAAAEAALRQGDTDTLRDAVRMLARWPNASAAPLLQELARNSTDLPIRILALRGCIEVSALEPDPSKRLELLGAARSAAQRPDEKKLALAKISLIPTPAALEIAMADLADPELTTEAALAVLAIAEQIAAANPALAAEAATKVLAGCKHPEMVKRAWALRGNPAGARAFIQDWLLSGPYHQPGAIGALALFDIAFEPEKPGGQAAWKPAPHMDHVNLLAVFPDQTNCAAYLKTRIIAEQDCAAVLLMGSDDGIKAWLNGALVHSNNADRGDLPDQDMAAIQLRKGANDLMLKVTQGGGGWSARARITGADGQPLPGLSFTAPQDH